MRRISARGAATAALVLFATAALGVGAGVAYYRVSAGVFIDQATRVAAAAVLDVAYRGDLAVVDAQTSSYLHGDPGIVGAAPGPSWRRLAAATPGLQVISAVDHVPFALVPFVYEDPDAPHLTSLRARYQLDRLVEPARDDYDAALRLGGWLGGQFDHGADPLAGHGKVCDPVGVIEDGRAGQKYWCEIAALTTVHAAAALGWVSRLVTASLDGYAADHAVAEIWSDRFDKWFVVDTDFNVVYESDGTPLSASELVMTGQELQRAGRLTIRPIAPPKPAIPDPGAASTVGMYRYVHVDMRSDWCSRRLRRGSPAGGDRATWWLALPSFPAILTAKTRVDAPTFDWPVNHVHVHAQSARRTPDGSLSMTLALTTYSPRFVGFELSVDDQPWRRGAGPETVTLPKGEHVIRARAVTRSAFPGRTTEVRLIVAG